MNSGLTKKGMIALAAITLTQGVFAVCNGYIKLTRPDSRYEAVLGATPVGSEVRDKVTGLIWRRCVEGMIWSGSTCVGTISRFTWEQALERANTAKATTAKPMSTWHVPEYAELYTLPEKACSSPAINSVWFPGQSSVYPVSVAWSSESDGSSSGGSWGIDFDTGNVSRGNNNYNFSVRLVRSGS